MLHQKLFILFFLLCFSTFVDNKNNVKLKLRILEMGDCRTPQYKPSNDKSITVSFKLTDIGSETYYDCNYTVVRKFGPAAITIRMYQLFGNKEQKLVYKMDRMSCKTLLIQQLIRVTKMAIDKDCYALPTSVSLVNGTFEKTSWMWTRGATSPGKYAYEVEITVQDTSFLCYRIVANIFEKKH